MRRDPASIESLLSSGRILLQAPDPVVLEEMVAAAERDIQAADANKIGFSPWADAMLYEACLRSVRVIVQAAGYRIDSGAGAHVTAIDAADALTDRQHHTIFVRLHRMRRRRHDFMYQTTADPTEQDLAQARTDALFLIGLARRSLERIG